MFKDFIDNLKLYGIKTLAIVLCFGSLVGVFTNASFSQCKGLVGASKTEITKSMDKKSDFNTKEKDAKLDKENCVEVENTIAKNQESKMQILKKFWKPTRWVLSFLMTLVTPSINQYINGKRMREVVLYAETVGVYCIWNWIFECVGKKFGLE